MIKLARFPDGTLYYLTAEHKVHDVVRGENAVVRDNVRDFAIDTAGLVYFLGTDGVLEQTDVQEQQSNASAGS